MKNKSKIFLNVITICLALCAVIFGVYSLKSATLNIGGEFGFTAHDCIVQTYGTVCGDLFDGSVRQEEANVLLDENDNLLSSTKLMLISAGPSTPYSYATFSDIWFSDNSTYTQVMPITIRLYFRNLSSFPIVAKVTRIQLPDSVTSAEISSIAVSETISELDSPWDNSSSDTGCIQIVLSVQDNNVSIDEKFAINFSFEPALYKAEWGWDYANIDTTGNANAYVRLINNDENVVKKIDVKNIAPTTSTQSSGDFSVQTKNQRITDTNQVTYVNTSMYTASVTHEGITYTDTVNLVETKTLLQKAYIMSSDPDNMGSDIINAQNVLDSPSPLQLTWNVDSQDPDAKIYISKHPDLSDCNVYYTSAQEILIENLLPSTKYYFQIVYDDVKSGINTFTTVAYTGGNFYNIDSNSSLDDHCNNFRDIGGWAIGDSNFVKPGMLYRGAMFGASYGGNTVYISNKGVNFVLNELGVKNEIDVRTSGSGGAKDVMCLGENYINFPSSSVSTDLTTSDGVAWQNVFKALANPDNYPIYFHCTFGRDRTGYFGSILLALLGCSETDVRKEYLLSNFSKNGDFKEGCPPLNYVLNYQYPADAIYPRPKDGSLADKTYNFLYNAYKLTQEELDTIIRLLTY